MNSLVALLVVVGVLAVSVYSEAAGTKVYFVSEKGNDSWSGTSEKAGPSKKQGPFKNIEQARDQIRKLRKSGFIGPVQVVIAPGIYQLNSPLEFTKQDSGTQTTPVVYKARIPGKTRLIGGKVISGFKKVTDPALLTRMDPKAAENVYIADLKSSGVTDLQPVNSAGAYESDPGIEVFFNNQPMTLARYPNTGYMQIGEIINTAPSGQPVDSAARFVCEDPRISRWTNEKGIWMHGFWYWDWADQRVELDQIDPDSRIVTLAGSKPAYGVRQGQWFYAQNVLPELDMPGEWYIDRDSGRLLIWPTAPITSGSVIVSVVRDLIRLKEVSNIVLQGLLVEASRGSAVSVSGGSNVKIVGCTFRNMGKWAVRVTGGTNHLVVGCDIYATGQGGIHLEGGDRKTLKPANLVANNNHVHHTSRWDPVYQQAIALFGVGNTAVHNLIDNVPHVAIGFSGNEQTIEYNEIHSSVFQSNDAGAIYTSPPDETWSMRGHKIRYNYLHNIHGFRGKGCQGVYLDDCFSSADISGNIFYDVASAILIGGGRDNLMSNNMFVDCSQAFSIDARGLGWAAGVGVFATKELHDLNYQQPPWSLKYPELLNILEDQPLAPKGNVVERNVLWNTKLGWIEGRAQPLIKMQNNLQDKDPKFKYQPPKSFALAADSPAWKIGFKPIEFEKIGIYRSANRASWPVTSKLRVDPKPPKQEAKPAVDRPVPVYKVKTVEKTPTVDGQLKPEEWFGLDSDSSIVIQQGVQGETIKYPSNAWIVKGKDSLYVAIDNRVDPLHAIVIGEVWGHCDAVELAITDPLLKEKAPVIVLRGYASGKMESSTEAGASPEAAARAGRNVVYKAAVIDKGRWTAEFKIPFAALGFMPVVSTRYPFNISVRKQGDQPWVMWRGTGDFSWAVSQAGVIIF